MQQFHTCYFSIVASIDTFERCPRLKLLYLCKLLPLTFDLFLPLRNSEQCLLENKLVVVAELLLRPLS